MDGEHRTNPSGELRARGAGGPLAGRPGRWTAIADATTVPALPAEAAASR